MAASTRCTCRWSRSAGSWSAWAIRKRGSAIPYDGSWSHSPYEDAERLAGIAAWYYEKDGMPPMLIGHSQGGMQAVKVLHVLNGEYSAARSRVEPAHRFCRGAHGDRRSAYRQRAAGRRD